MDIGGGKSYKFMENITDKELLLELIKRIKNQDFNYSFKYWFDSGEIVLELSSNKENQRIQICGNYDAEKLYNKRKDWEKEELEKKNNKKLREDLFLRLRLMYLKNRKPKE